jgi:ATP-binding cassette, subfamily B, bacterial
MRKQKHSSFGRIIRGCLKRSWRQISIASLCVVGSTLAALAAPWPLKMIFDHVLLGRPLPESIAFLAPWITHGSTASLAALSFVLVLLALLSAMFAYSQLLITSRIGFEIIFALRTALFDHLQRLSLSFHARTRSGELLNKMVADTNTLKDIYSDYVLQLATHVLTVIGMCAVMLALNWRLGLMVMATFPVLFGILIVLLSRIQKSARRQRHQESEIASRLGEVLNAVPLVQAFGRERFESARFADQSAQSKEESIKTARIEATVARLVEIVRAFGTAMVMFAGGALVLTQQMSPGDLLVFSAYIIGLYKPVRVMARLSARMSKASASAERIRGILDQEPEISDVPGAVEATNMEGRIEFQSVSFGYELGKRALHDVSFEVPAGRRVALVGASGAGKSTIANLVVRFYDPSAGRVMIDGRDVVHYQRQSLRERIGVVLQDTLLFGTSIRENIAYGKPDATHDEIEAAARLVAAHEFIMQLPNGYDEVLGEGGASLSGGQRQRLCLARALIKKPQILIMDEPTSAVDAESEAKIRKALVEAQTGKTTLLIAHHLQSVRDADEIIVMRKGRIVERGTHDALVRLGGYYCDLFQIARPISA